MQTKVCLDYSACFQALTLSKMKLAQTTGSKISLYLSFQNCKLAGQTRISEAPTQSYAFEARYITGKVAKSKYI